MSQITRRGFVNRSVKGAAALAAGILAVAEPALAAVDHYEVQVDGLACPFCAYGLEKKAQERYAKFFNFEKIKALCIDAVR